jgi:hypothetical protein
MSNLLQPTYSSTCANSILVLSTQSDAKLVCRVVLQRASFIANRRLSRAVFGELWPLHSFPGRRAGRHRPSWLRDVGSAASCALDWGLKATSGIVEPGRGLARQSSVSTAAVETVLARLPSGVTTLVAVRFGPASSVMGGWPRPLQSPQVASRGRFLLPVQFVRWDRRAGFRHLRSGPGPFFRPTHYRPFALCLPPTACGWRVRLNQGLGNLEGHGVAPKP